MSLQKCAFSGEQGAPLPGSARNRPQGQSAQPATSKHARGQIQQGERRPPHQGPYGADPQTNRPASHERAYKETNSAKRAGRPFCTAIGPSGIKKIPRRRSEFNKGGARPALYSHLGLLGWRGTSAQEGTNAPKRAQRPLCTAIEPIWIKIQERGRERAEPTWRAEGVKPPQRECATHSVRPRGRERGEGKSRSH